MGRDLQGPTEYSVDPRDEMEVASEMLVPTCLTLLCSPSHRGIYLSYLLSEWGTKLTEYTHSWNISGCLKKIKGGGHASKVLLY